MASFIFVPLIYFLTVFQTSFFIFFDIQGFVFNFVLLAILLFNILETPEKNQGLILAISAGFFLDIFSSEIFGVSFIGFRALALFTLSLFIKYIFKKHIHLYG